MDFMLDKIAQRLGGRSFGQSTDVYKFALIKAAKAEAKAKNPDIPLIDMGVGEPDTPADIRITRVLGREAGKSENRFYSDNGINEFQEAAAAYLDNIYGVKVESPYMNILHGIGSKTVLAMIPSIFINPGDVTLATVPGYPVMSAWTRYLGGEVYNIPLTKENNFYPDLNGIPEEVLERAKLLYINYPNNPTGQVATKEFYESVIEFAKKNGVAVISDAAYASLIYDGNPPLSFLSTDGAMDVGMEIHSLSKAFNMTGWRLAFAAGNTTIIKAYGTIKDNFDSGQFRAIQKAGVFALNHPEITEGIRKKYSRRFDLLVKALKDVGFDAQKPKGTFYLYVNSPKGAGERRFKSAQEAAACLIREALVSVVPWDDAGQFLRFSVTFEAGTEEEEKMIVDELKQRLIKLDLVF